MTDAEVWAAIGTLGGALWLLSALVDLVYRLHKVKHGYIRNRLRKKLREARAAKGRDKTKGLRPLFYLLYNKCVTLSQHAVGDDQCPIKRK